MRHEGSYDLEDWIKNPTFFKYIKIENIYLKFSYFILHIWTIIV